MCGAAAFMSKSVPSMCISGACVRRWNRSLVPGLCKPCGAPATGFRTPLLIEQNYGLAPFALQDSGFANGEQQVANRGFPERINDASGIPAKSCLASIARTLRRPRGRGVRARTAVACGNVYFKCGAFGVLPVVAGHAVSNPGMVEFAAA